MAIGTKNLDSQSGVGEHRLDGQLLTEAGTPLSASVLQHLTKTSNELWRLLYDPVYGHTHDGINSVYIPRPIFCEFRKVIRDDEPYTSYPDWFFHGSGAVVYENRFYPPLGLIDFNGSTAEKNLSKWPTADIQRVFVPCSNRIKIYLTYELCYRNLTGTPTILIPLLGGGATFNLKITCINTSDYITMALKFCTVPPFCVFEQVNDGAGKTTLEVESGVDNDFYFTVESNNDTLKYVFGLWGLAMQEAEPVIT